MCVSSGQLGAPSGRNMASKLYNFSDSAYDVNALIVVFKTDTAHVKMKGKLYSNM